MSLLTFTNPDTTALRRPPAPSLSRPHGHVPVMLRPAGNSRLARGQTPCLHRFGRGCSALAANVLEMLRQGCRQVARIFGGTPVSVVLAAFTLLSAGCKSSHFSGGGGLTSGGKEHDSQLFAEPRGGREPETTVVEAGETATFHFDEDPVTGENKSFRWYFNGSPMSDLEGKVYGSHSQTLNVLNAVPGDAGLYACLLSRYRPNQESEPKFRFSRSVELLVVTNGSVVVYGTPLAGSGTGTGCPGAYQGYVNYRKTSPPYGWRLADVEGGSARDGTGRTDVWIKWFDGVKNGCGLGSVPVPYASGRVCRFTIYFPNGVPATGHPIQLEGFAQ